MRRYIPIVVSLICIAMFQCETAAQPPAPKPGDGPAKGKQKDYSNSSIVKKMMAFDKNGDGKLTKDEVTDPRLHRLFDRADVNKDGVVTKEELMTLAAQMEAEITDGRGREGPGDGFGRGGRGRGGRGGPGGFGGPSRPGQILPAFLQDELNLSADQKKQVGELQKQIDEKLAKILTDTQRARLKEMQQGFGRGGRGPGGRGRGGPGGPGGPPDAGPGGPSANGRPDRRS